MTATESNNLYDEWGEIPLDGVPCTLEEVSQDIADAEAEMDAGFMGTPHEEVMRRLREEFPWLK